MADNWEQEEERLAQQAQHCLRQPRRRLALLSSQETGPVAAAGPGSSAGTAVRTVGTLPAVHHTVAHIVGNPVVAGSLRIADHRTGCSHRIAGRTVGSHRSHRRLGRGRKRSRPG